jgi:hypothetical protein
MDPMVRDEYEFRLIMQQVIDEMIADGKLERVGREANGDPVYRSTAPVSTGRRVWRSISFVFVVPALVAEYAVGLSSVAVAKVCGGTPAVYAMVDLASRLRMWRHLQKQQQVWLSIKY